MTNARTEINRRHFCLTTLAAGSAAVFSTPMLAWTGRHRTITSEAIETQKLRDGAYAVLGNGGVILLVPGDAGPIMVDTKFAWTTNDVAETAKQTVGAAPTLVINTHHHADHSGGNWAWKNDATLVGHQNLKPRIAGNLDRYKSGVRNAVVEMKRAGADDASLKGAVERLRKVESLKAEAFEPNRMVADRETIEHGEVTIELHHFGAGHTDNDLVVHFPKQNILHMGDLLFHKNHPFIDRSAGADTNGWQMSLKKAMNLCDDETIVIPGHGDITDMVGLRDMLIYFDQLRSVVKKAMTDGKTREEITAMKPDEFEDRGFERLQGNALGAMYDELKEKSQ